MPVPPKRQRYDGMRGSTQGDTKESSPAPKARKKEIPVFIKIPLDRYNYTG
jgi:hypothetical protein